MPNTNNIACAGFDPGHNAYKIARVQGDEITTYALPATVGLANRSKKDGLSFGGVIRQRPGTTRQPFQIVFEGVEYLVGPDVDKFTKPIDRLDVDRFDSPELRAAFYACVYRIFNGGPHQLALAIALPVALLEDEAQALQRERYIRHALVTEHIFSVDGVEAVLTITNVRAKIPQPIATWFEWGMDNRGEWIRGKQALTAPTLIIDEGFNTLDVVVIEDGRISNRLSKGDTLGMGRAAEELIETIEHQYGVSVELYRANELIKTAVNGQKAETYVHGKLTDVTQIAKSCVQSVAADVDNYLLRSLGKMHGAHAVILTGGGIIALRDRLLRRFPEATVMHEPILANARGLAKAAMRPGFLD
jgi:hypothetical protein